MAYSWTQRVDQPKHDFRLRLWTGPKAEFVTLDNIASGSGYTPTTKTTLASTATFNDTTISLESALGFDMGAVCLNAWYGWQAAFITYTGVDGNDLTGCEWHVRDTKGTAQYLETYDTDTEVVEWFPITPRVLGVDVSWSDHDGVAYPRITLEGHNYHSLLIERDSAVLCMIDVNPATSVYGNWSGWLTWWTGYIKDVQPKDTHRRDRAWTATVEGISMYLGVDEIEPKEYGKNDLADGKSVTVSSTLEDPFTESDSGEFLGLPQLDGSNIVDDDFATLWMSYLTVTGEYQEEIAGGWTIGEFMLNARPGDPDIKWIEVFFKGEETDQAIKGLHLLHKETSFIRYNREELEQITDETDPNYGDWVLVGTPYSAWRPGVNLDAEPDPKYGNYINLTRGLTWMMDVDGNRAVFTNDKQGFLAKHPNHSARFVFDWRRWMVGNFDPDPGQDWIMLWMHDWPEDIVWYDDGSGGWALEEIDNLNLSGTNKSGWTGPMVDVSDMDPGDSVQRTPDGYRLAPWGQEQWPMDNTYWEISQAPTPGHRHTGLPEWFMIDLGEMGILLEEELSATETGQIALDRAPNGLTNGGLLRLDTEFISYESIDWDSNLLLTLVRGLGDDGSPGGSTPAIHTEDTVVEQVEDQIAHRAPLIQTVEWKRREAVDSDGELHTNVPTDFRIFISTSASPNNPGQGIDPETREDNWEDWWEQPPEMGGWQAHWSEIFFVEGHDSVYWTGSTDTAKRARHILMVIWDMSETSTRARMNTFRVYAHRFYFISDEDNGGTPDYAASSYEGTLAAHVIQDLLLAGGVPDTSISLIDLGGPTSGLKTTKRSCLSLIRDLCKRSGLCVLLGLNHEAEVRYHPAYPLGGLTDSVLTFSRDNATKVDASYPFRHNVSQIHLVVEDPVTEERSEVSYPPKPLLLGRVKREDEMILGGIREAGLMAELMFRESNMPREITFDTVGPCEMLKPFDRVIVEWSLDEDDSEVHDVNFFVSSISHRIRLGGGSPNTKSWDTTVSLKETAW